METIVTRWRWGDSPQKISLDTGIAVKEVIAVLRQNSKLWDGVN
jgi:hypothetical protein